LNGKVEPGRAGSLLRRDLCRAGGCASYAEGVRYRLVPGTPSPAPARFAVGITAGELDSCLDLADESGDVVLSPAFVGEPDQVFHGLA
jgi:hypothetical protein